MKLTQLEPARDFEIRKWIEDSLPIKWIFTGKWGYGQKFYDNFHAKWTTKLNL